MNQFFICAGCGAENEIVLDLVDGDYQHRTVACEGCGSANEIGARFNYTTNEFELEVSVEDAG